MAIVPAEVTLGAWLKTHPAYSYTVKASELDAAGHIEDATLRVVYHSSGPLEQVHVVSGKGAGADITWHGANSVVVRPGGIFHVVSVSMSVRDPRILSPRGNDVRIADLSDVAACFAQRARMVSAPANEMIFEIDEPGQDSCGAHDDGITRDRIVFSSDGEPIRRERYVGNALVEAWAISDFAPLAR